MPGSARQGRTLAVGQNVAAVVWISRADEGYALWIYDRESDQVVARRLASGPPFDESAAAAMALSIKTLLRYSTVAPEQARLPAGEVKRTEKPTTVPTRETRGEKSRRPVALLLEGSGGVRFLRTDRSKVEARLGLGLFWRPRTLQQRLALGLQMKAGPSLGIDFPDFVGSLSDTSFGLYGRGRLSLGSGFMVGCGLGGALHLSGIEGTLPGSGEHADAHRMGVSLSLLPQIDYSPGAGFVAGIRAGVALFPYRQRYLVHGRPVVDTEPFAVETALYLQAPIY